MPGLPSGRRVIALREVDEMARTRTPLPHYWHRPARPTISETCRSGEGIALVRVAPAMVDACLAASGSPAPRGDRPEAACPVRRVGLPGTSGQRRRRRRLEHSMETLIKHSMETVITRMEDTRAKSVARG